MLVATAGMCVLLLVRQLARCTACSRNGAEPYATHEVQLSRARSGSADAAAARAARGRPVAAAAPPPPERLIDGSLGHILLPLTNLTNMTTASLLDAAANATTDQKRGLVRLHQDLHCR